MTAKPRAEITLRAQPFDSPDAALLVELADATNTALYGHPDETPLHSQDFDPERRGLFVVAYDSGRPVACGGYREFPDDPTGATAEVKRMFVVADLRRSGLGRSILAHLENSARTRGYHRIVLDVGSRQHPAHALYEAAGYDRTAGYSIYRDRPGNRAYAKEI